MKVSEILIKKGSNIIGVFPETSLQEAVNKLVSHGVGSLLVTDPDGRIVGIITERDILRATAEHFDGLTGRAVSEFMTTDVLIGFASDEVSYVENIMTDNRIRHLPIMDEGKLAGMISIGDVVKAHRQRAEIEVRHLTDYITGQYPGMV